MVIPTRHEDSEEEEDVVAKYDASPEPPYMPKNKQKELNILELNKVI